MTEEPICHQPEDNLKLTGDKINLTVRPISKENTASSRCARLMQGLSRPASAVPLLNLYDKADFDYFVRRPLSAERAPFHKTAMTNGDVDSSQNDDDKKLNSTQLLKNLLSEPIKSWREFRVTKTDQSNKETSAAKSEDSNFESSCEQVDCHRKNKFDLTPGLKTKPPLPRRVETPKPMTDRQDNRVEIMNSTFESDKCAKSELSFNNWVRDDPADILANEMETDLLLEELKIQHQINKSFGEEVKSGKEEDFKSPIKALRTVKKLRINADAIKAKPKIMAKIIKSDSDYEQDSGNTEIDSWMSKQKRKSARGNKSKNVTTRQSANYLDCLEKIDDLEQSSSSIETVDILNDVPVRDVGKNAKERDDTYDEIVSILLVLEEEDKKSQKKMETIKEIVNNELSTPNTEEHGHEEIFGTNSENSRMPFLKITDTFTNPEHKTSFDNLEAPFFKSSETFASSKHKINVENLEIPFLKSAETFTNSKKKNKFSATPNLSEIFSYLDEVDKSCIQSISSAKERISSATQIIENNIIQLDTIPRLEDLQCCTGTELAHHVIDLSLRIKEKSSCITMLQKEISGLREQVTKTAKQTDEAIKQKLKGQKDEYEGAIRRHQKFIDQLITDKKTLNQQCESLINEIKILEDRFSSNAKASDHRHQVEIHKLKEMHAAGEKIRRDRWIDCKTQKIKEMTVKGLEPELERMATRHQQELTDLRALHKREIEDLDLRAARKNQQQCESLREQLVTEREKALAHEREIMRQRYEKMVESEEKGYQEQRRRLLTEHANRIKDCEEKEAAVLLEKERAIKASQSEFDEHLQAAIRRHNNELNLLKERLELEMEAFTNNYKKQQALEIARMETSILERFRKEKDKEIEKIVERFKVEECERMAQNNDIAESRIRRVKDKYEAEIADLEQAEKDAKAKYSETKTKLIEFEDVSINLKAAIKQLEMQLLDSKTTVDQLTSERNKVKEIIRGEMRQEIELLQKEVGELKNSRDKELQQVYARVKVAVARKDEILQELTRDHTALQEKCAYLENMLEQQRKEYLIK